MYCKNCGKDIGDARYCPYCGSVQEDELQKLEERYGGAKDSSYSTESYYGGGLSYGAADRMREIFRDTRFLVITILVTVNAVFSLFSGSITINGTKLAFFNLAAVFPVLFCIALWLCWAEGRKSGGDMSTTGLAMASGTAKAMWIVIWVAIGIMAVSAVLLIIGGSAIANYLPFEVIKGLPGDLYQEIPGLKDLDVFSVPGAYTIAKNYYETVSNALFIFIGIAALVAIAVLIVFNIFFYRKLHRFIKSICEGVRLDRLDVVYAVPVKNWLIVIAVFNFIGAVGSVSGIASFFGFAGGLCSGVASILSSVMIKRYFADQNL